MDGIGEGIAFVRGWFWSPPFLILLLGTHLFMTFRTGVIQKYTGLGIRLSVTKDPEAPGDVSPFRSLMTALSSTLGTGNIVGVGVAIAAGGPGALLWLWLTGVFGIATKYSESLIAFKYRVRTSDGTMAGGAMYALERGLKCRWGGLLFAGLTALSALGMGSTVQSNSLSTLFQSNLGVAPWITGMVAAFLVFLVIAGGVHSITRVCAVMVPFMTLFYIGGCLIILFLNRAYLGETFAVIFESAFSGRAAGGGFIGAGVMTAMQSGIARGLFSNESGMGSSPIVAAAAKSRNSVRQALISSTGTFWDTVVVCALTGLVLVSTVIANPAVSANEVGGLANGALLTSQAFGAMGAFGPVFLTVSMAVFAFSTILGWYYYGERGIEYLLGKDVIPLYRNLYVVAVFLGTIVSLDVIWNLADILNGLMALPNLVAVILLSGVVARETRYYMAGRINEREAAG